MKTIVISPENVSLFLLEDSVQLDVQPDHIYSANHNATITFLNASNCAIHEDVNAPVDWAPEKYLFDGVTWSANPDYVG